MARSDSTSEFANDSSQPVDVATALGNAAADSVTAEITGGGVKANSITINADSAITTDNLAGGVGVGVDAGVGVGIAYTEVNNTVVAAATQGTVNASALTVSALTHNGSGGSAADAQAFAGAGAVYGAVNGAVADAVLNNSVTATVGGTIAGGAGTGNLVISAADNMSASAEATGAAVSGLAPVAPPSAWPRKAAASPRRRKATPASPGTATSISPRPPRAA